MNTYQTNFQKKWIEAGGLIQPTIAAKILGVTRGRIAHMQEENRLTIYKDEDNKTMLSYAEITKLSEEKTRKYKITYNWEIKKLQKKGKATRIIITNRSEENKLKTIIKYEISEEEEVDQLEININIIKIKEIKK